MLSSRTSATLRAGRLLLRAAALLVVLSLAALVAWPSCDSDDDAAPTSADPSFGADIRVTILGRGRVRSRNGAIDCPSTCFGRMFVEAGADGGKKDVTLIAEATPGAYFSSWIIEKVDLGMRAAGPAGCSPMTRPSAVPEGSLALSKLTLPFGVTTATPPAGHEAECADFTSVPVAYAVTAKFVEEIEPGRDASADGSVELLFEAPDGGAGAAREIGVAGGRVYWRFQRENEAGSPVSGVASGLVSGGAAEVVVDAVDDITQIDIDGQVMLQHSNGKLDAVQAGTTAPITLNYFPQCVSLASDDLNVYCRYAGGASTGLYMWPLPSAQAEYLFSLPKGEALAVDQQRIYFAEDLGGVGGPHSTIESSHRSGSLTITELVPGQGTPRALIAGADYLYWLDDRAGGRFATVAPKTGGPGVVRAFGSDIRFIAADPKSPSFWIARAGINGTYSIERGSAATPGTTVVHNDILGLGGLAMDGTYLYWTQLDGRVYRAGKSLEAP